MKKLDILINDADVPGSCSPVGAVQISDIQPVFGINIFVIIRVTDGFLPLLEKSSNPVIVNVSSGLGSMDKQKTQKNWIKSEWTML